MNAAEEIIVIVDEHNREIGQCTRKAMRRDRLIHRASYVLVFDRRGDLFIQKRTMTKDVYPGYYDVAAGGVVLSGESYEESAERELFEELGIRAPLAWCFDHFHDDAENRVWGRVFTCIHNGPMVLQQDEVENGEFMPVSEVLEMSGLVPFTPDGIEILRNCLDSAHGVRPGWVHE